MTTFSAAPTSSGGGRGFKTQDPRRLRPPISSRKRFFVTVTVTVPLARGFCLTGHECSQGSHRTRSRRSQLMFFAMAARAATNRPLQVFYPAPRPSKSRTHWECPSSLTRCSRITALCDWRQKGWATHDTGKGHDCDDNEETLIRRSGDNSLCRFCRCKLEIDTRGYDRSALPRLRSSWAICQYRNHWRNHGGFRGPEYEKVQQRVRANCNPATVWKDACR
jgi:hypothetical protein